MVLPTALSGRWRSAGAFDPRERAGALPDLRGGGTHGSERVPSTGKPTHPEVAISRRREHDTLPFHSPGMARNRDAFESALQSPFTSRSQALVMDPKRAGPCRQHDPSWITSAT